MGFYLQTGFNEALRRSRGREWTTQPDAEYTAASMALQLQGLRRLLGIYDKMDKLFGWQNFEFGLSSLMKRRSTL